MRRFAFVIATSAALIACGQPASTATVQGSAAAGASQADFIARCTRDMVAENPRASEWAGGQCQQEWEKVVSAGPMADAILAAAPVSGAADPETLRGRLSMIQWHARPEGTLIASGRIGPALSVQVDRAGPNLNFFWGETGALIPYDVIEALRGRGAEVSMVGCMLLGTGEANKLYRVSAPGRAPFALSLYERGAPTANAASFYNVSINLSGQAQTLAQLRRDGNEWNATCAQ